MSEPERAPVIFRDYETARLLDYRDGKIYDKGGYEVWPDAPDCICVPEWAELDTLSGSVYVQFKPDPACPVHRSAD